MYAWSLLVELHGEGKESKGMYYFESAIVIENMIIADTGHVNSYHFQ